MKHLLSAFLIICLFTLNIAAQEERADPPSEYFALTSLLQIGCGSGQTTFQTVSYRSSNHVAMTLVKAKGKTYTDERTSISVLGYVVSTWALFNNNSLDRMQRTLPLPKNTPFTTEVTMASTAFEPQWRTVASVNKCNNGVLTGTINYDATELLLNNSFEAFDGTYQPAYWAPNQDAVNGTNGVQCAATLAGDCYLRLTSAAGTKIKYSQVWTGKIGGAGQTVELSFLQRLSTSYSGGGKVVATLTFANGTTKKLQIDATGAVNNGWHMSTAKATMPAALKKVKVVITQKNGTPGTTWHIDGLAVATFRQRGLPAPPGPRDAVTTIPGSDMFNGD